MFYPQTDYAIAPQSNRLLQIPDAALEDRYYDAIGNLTEDAGNYRELKGLDSNSASDP